MGNTTKILVIYDDDEYADMIFFDSVAEVAKEYKVPEDKISDIIAGKTKGVSNSKYSKQTEYLSILRVSLINYQYYNDDIITAIENFNAIENINPMNTMTPEEKLHYTECKEHIIYTEHHRECSKCFDGRPTYGNCLCSYSDRYFCTKCKYWFEQYYNSRHKEW